MLAGGRLCCIQMSLDLIVGGLEEKYWLFQWKLQSRSKLWNCTAGETMCSGARALREVMTSSSFYFELVANGPPGWSGDRNHGAFGTGVGQTSRESSEARQSRGALGFTSFVSACCYLQ